MYSHILVGIALDHVEESKAGMEVARALLADGGRITALHVLEALAPGIQTHLPHGFTEDRHREANRQLVEATGEADDVHHSVVTGHSSRTILELAAAHRVDLIVLASHRPGLEDYFLGSTAARVVRHAQCSVHVMR